MRKLESWDVLLLALCILWGGGLLWMALAGGPAIILRLDRQDSAEWAAAIATFLAVIAALVISQSESRRARSMERQRRRHSEHQRLKAGVIKVLLVTSDIEALDEICLKQTWDPLVAPTLRANLQRSVTALDGLALEDFPTIEYARQVITIGISAHGSLAVVDHILSLGKKGQQPPKETFKMYRDRANEAENKFNELFRGERVAWKQ